MTHTPGHGVDVVAAIDVGGTRIKAALVDSSFVPLATSTTPTPFDLSSDLPRVVTLLVESLIADLRAGVATGVGDVTPGHGDVRLRGCGIVVPGLVDEASGVGVLAVNLGWKNLDIAGPLSQRLGVPAVLGHDVRAGLVAEVRLGAARGARHALFMPLGTGIAGALMLDGHVITADGWAGELGHMVVDPVGPQCNCGARGCLETVSSASAIERAYAERTGRRIGADEVAALVAGGDPVATEVWHVGVNALAGAVASIVSITGVDLLLVGGGLSHSGELLLRPLRAAVEERLTFQRRPRIVAAELGDRAGSLGAACLAWDAVSSLPGTPVAEH
jgi:glucokinase